MQILIQNISLNTLIKYQLSSTPEVPRYSNLLAQFKLSLSFIIAIIFSALGTAVIYHILHQRKRARRTSPSGTPFSKIKGLERIKRDADLIVL